MDGGFWSSVEESLLSIIDPSKPQIYIKIYTWLTLQNTLFQNGSFKHAFNFMYVTMTRFDKNSYLITDRLIVYKCADSVSFRCADREWFVDCMNCIYYQAREHNSYGCELCNKIDCH